MDCHRACQRWANARLLWQAPSR